MLLGSPLEKNAFKDERVTKSVKCCWQLGKMRAEWASSRQQGLEPLMEMTSDGEKLEMASADSYCEGFYFKREQRNSTIAGRGHR